MNHVMAFSCLQRWIDAIYTAEGPELGWWVWLEIQAKFRRILTLSGGKNYPSVTASVWAHPTMKSTKAHPGDKNRPPLYVTQVPRISIRFEESTVDVCLRIMEQASLSQQQSGSSFKSITSVTSPEKKKDRRGLAEVCTVEVVRILDHICRESPSVVRYHHHVIDLIVDTSHHW